MSSFTSASEVSVGADGLASVLDQFRVAPTDDLADLPIADRHAFQTKMVSVSKAIGGRLPDAPRGFPGQQSADGFARYFEGALSASRGDVSEISAVGAATTADILFNAASIGPMVVSAADFSRIEDISDIFKLTVRRSYCLYDWRGSCWSGQQPSRICFRTDRSCAAGST